MPKFIDLTGQRFGRLIVIRRMDNNKWGSSRWLCQCICGKEKIILGSHLYGGNTESCGCFNKDVHTKHGHSTRIKTTVIYAAWRNMIQRCTNPNNPRYKYYGGREIKVCKRWMKFENFLEDMLDGWKHGLTLERKNNKKGYYKKNCKWVTSKEQGRNKRNNRLITCFGKTQCLSVWAEEYNIPYKILWDRIYKLGWSPERALTEPVKKQKKKVKK